MEMAATLVYAIMGTSCIVRKWGAKMILENHYQKKMGRTTMRMSITMHMRNIRTINQHQTQHLRRPLTIVETDHQQESALAQDQHQKPNPTPSETFNNCRDRSSTGKCLGSR